MPRQGVVAALITTMAGAMVVTRSARVGTMEAIKSARAGTSRVGTMAAEAVADTVKAATRRAMATEGTSTVEVVEAMVAVDGAVATHNPGQSPGRTLPPTFLR